MVTRIEKGGVVSSVAPDDFQDTKTIPRDQLIKDYRSLLEQHTSSYLQGFAIETLGIVSAVYQMWVGFL